MTNQTTKMLIITSNEDLIHELSTKTSKDTHIINFNENQFTSSISKDNANLLDLTFLAQLSELNSSNDQMYKRVLDSPQKRRSKVAKISKKLSDLVCVICGDCAIGFNYDVLTCASCKAFFRRNAKHQPSNLRCLTDEKKCSISHHVSRKCQRCRLEKCFEMGMRKDLILSEEEKQIRRQRLEENRQLSNEYHSSQQSISSSTHEYFSQSIHEIDQLLMDTDNANPMLDDETGEEKGSCASLSIEDWLDIENIKSSYSSIFVNEHTKCASFDMSDHQSALISWSELANERILKLIHFCRQIDQFESLHIDDRFLLIKYNLLPLYILQKSLYYNLSTGTFLFVNDEERLKRRQFFQLCYGTSGIRESFKTFMHSFSLATEQDLTLIKLVLILLIFSKGLSMNENEPLFQDSLAVYRAQSYYLKLIWNYLLYKQGEEKTIKQFLKLFNEITRLQTILIQYRHFFRIQFQSRDTLERFSPLMQAILNID